MDSAGRALQISGLALVAVLSVMTSGCSSGESSSQPETGPPSAMPSSSETPNPCGGEGADNAPPSSSPDAEDYVGLTTKEANAKAREQSQEIRVAGRDGECYPLTMDYRPDRVNIYLESGLVVAATLG